MYRVSYVLLAVALTRMWGCDFLSISKVRVRISTRQPLRNDSSTTRPGDTAAILAYLLVDYLQTLEDEVRRITSAHISYVALKEIM